MYAVQSLYSGKNTVQRNHLKSKITMTFMAMMRVFKRLISWVNPKARVSSLMMQNGTAIVVFLVNHESHLNDNNAVYT